MKNIKKTIIQFCVAVALLGLASCEELKFGDEFLSQTPETVGFTKDSVFSSQANAETILTKAYTFNRYPFFTQRTQGMDFGRTWIETITDLAIQYGQVNGSVRLVYPGSLNASNADDQGAYYTYGDEKEWDCIRYAYLFLKNVDDVPDMSEEIKTIRKGEANLLIAQRYFEMLREVGGVPWVDKSFDAGNLPSAFERMTVEEQVNKIDSLCDRAASQLPWYHTNTADYIRYTKASAMALKLKALLFAARPLFNSSEPYHPECDLSTWYGNYSVDRWKRAEAAGKAFMDALAANGHYGLVQPKGNTFDDYREAFADGYGTRSMEEGQREALLIQLPVDYRAGNNVVTEYDGSSPYWTRGFIFWRIQMSLKGHNMFPFADGTDFPEDFDWSNPPYNPWFDEEGNPSRDPRLYESVRINGDRWTNRWCEAWNPGNGFNKGRDIAGIGGIGVFHPRKFLREYDNATFRGKPIQYAFIRLPEVFLSYAEAINEANGGPNATAYDMINRVRNRVGLPDLTPGLNQEEFREALIRERACEFWGEVHTWYDQKSLKQVERFTDVVEGLRIYKTDAVLDDNYRENVWEYEVFTSPERYWWSNWDSKWLMWPFPQYEVDKGYGLTQNPGW